MLALARKETAMKLPSVELPAPEQITVDPQLTLALAQASLAAYADYERKPVVPPPNYKMVARWTGWDDLFFDFGYEERFGVLFQCKIPGQTKTFIFAFRGTDSDMDAFEDPWFEPAPFSPYSGQVSPMPYVASGFNGIYTGIGGTMTKSMQQQVFSLLALYQPQTVYITGHSLGGALSQLFTLDMAVSTPNLWARNMNFSSPMVGTANWKIVYESQPAQKNPATRTVRVYNYWDYVPSLPSSWLYYTTVGLSFRTSFYVIDAWYPHLLSRHSILNLQIVLQNAVWLNPQVWVGTFKDAVEPALYMQSTVPPGGPDVRWIDKMNELQKFEQNILEGGKVQNAPQLSE
jgi:triacylglycerol lipase